MLTTANKIGAAMVEVENNSLVQTISVAAMALIALSVGIQKLLKDWRSTSAENTVIKMMHEELERMGAQNAKLTEELTKLQNEIVELNNQLTKLNIENNKLQQDIATLTLELNNFKKLAKG
jgi:septal ring factor EnvC (AmiA/AmiB activator)